MGRILSLILLLFFICLSSMAEEKSGEAEAFLIIKDSKKAYSADFSKFLESKGVRILQAWPPHAYIAHVPQDRQDELSVSGVLVYREKILDWTSLSEYGEKTVLAANTWNKRFVQDPPRAPLPVSLSVKAKSADSQELRWNEVMKACGYRLQISREKDFSEIFFQTLLSDNSYLILPAFWQDGVYRWRVSARLCLNSGENREGPFSDAAVFAVSSAVRVKEKASKKPLKLSFNEGVLYWPSVKAAYYRLRIFEKGRDKHPIIDVFTDTVSYRTAELLETGKNYLVEMETIGGQTGEIYAPVPVEVN